MNSKVSVRKNTTVDSRQLKEQHPNPNAQMNEMKTPTCYKCNITFKKMIYMDIHMKREHLETEYMRINRLKHSVELFESGIKQ